MAVRVHQFPCLEDNYGYLIQDIESGKVAAIDAPDATVIELELAKLGWELSLILNTHRHRDHCGGNEQLAAATGAVVLGPEEVGGQTILDAPVRGGAKLALGKSRIEVIDTPGHTAQHVAYYLEEDGILFVGDVLFALGCGRIFEGTPEMMWASLRRLAELPPETLVYCAHEYTEANARFALSVDDSPPLRARAEHVAQQRRAGHPTVPTTIGLELETNPFLRAPRLRPHLSDVDAFAEIRSAKDQFNG